MPLGGCVGCGHRECLDQLFSRENDVGAVFVQEFESLGHAFGVAGDQSGELGDLG